ncbi:MAG: LLM class flavin-dependent oxidoreductase [Thermomicrobiales bacterium]|nr:LLM class flavin-dependent oxidoreductase [Thermomicrobiales bacterium]
MTTTPRLGLIVTDIEDRTDNYTHSWQTMKDMVQMAEDVGFYSAWIPDHLIHEPAGVERYGIWESWSVVTALLAVTSKIKVGSHVLCTGWRNPALIAKMADTVDEISAGRLILALGAGWHEPEYRAFGFPFDHRIGRFDEAIQIIHGLLRDGHIDFEGEFYTARDCELRPRGPSNGDIPIMIGTIAGTPLGDDMGLQRKGWRMLDLVAKYADMWNCPTVADPALIPDIKAMVDEACDRNDRDRQSLDRSNGITVNLPGWQGHFGMTSVRKRRARSGVFTGDYAEIAAYIKQYADLGVDELHIQIDPENPQGVEQFGRVIELLRQ